MIRFLQIIILLVASTGFAQQYPVTYSIPDRIEAKAGATFTINVSFKADAPWYIYALTGNNAPQGMIETTIIYNLPKGFSRKGKIQLPKSKFKGGFEVYDGKEINFKQEFIVGKDIAPGEYIINGKINYQTCNDEICLPPMSDEIRITVTIKGVEAATVDTNNKAISLQFTALDGRKVAMANLKGKLVLIDCWATWCRPCIAEFEPLKKLYAKYRSKGFEIIGISMDEANAEERVRDLIANKKLTWPQWFEGKGFDENSFKKQYGIESLPAVFLIDKNGKIVDTNARGEKLEELICHYLGLKD